MNNKYEVGITPDDNNDIRLPGTVNPEPTMGAGEYNFAQPGPLDTKETAGTVGQPIVNIGFGMEGGMVPPTNSNVDVHNSDTTLNITSSEENLSKKYKYPQVNQDIPEKGRDQFEDHT